MTKSSKYVSRKRGDAQQRLEIQPFSFSASPKQEGGHYVSFHIAVRDILLGISAYALARVTEARNSAVDVEHHEDDRRAA